MFTRAEINKAKFIGTMTKPSHSWAKCRSRGRTRSFRLNEDTQGWIVDVNSEKPVILCDRCKPKKEEQQ